MTAPKGTGAGVCACDSPATVAKQIMPMGNEVRAILKLTLCAGKRKHGRATTMTVAVIFLGGDLHMATIGPSEITQLLQEWRAGHQSALDRLIPKVYDQLRRIARHRVKRERAGMTLQTTALINEAYVRLVDAGNVVWQDRAHFFAVASRVMRRILIDAARERDADKRGGQAQRDYRSSDPNFDQVPDLSPNRDRELIGIHEALEVLETVDPRKVRVVELRFFAGLSVEETAEVLKVSPQTVMRDWKLAKAWLSRELRGQDH